MRSTEALLAAYLDGVTELTPDERREVEALMQATPEAGAEAEATRQLLGQLRALTPVPPGTDEPDWSALERSISAAVGPGVPARRSQWLRWLMPAMAMTMATAALLLWLKHGEAPTVAIAPTVHPVAHAPAPVTPVAPTLAAPSAATSTVLLDGEAVDLDDIDDPGAVLEDLGGDIDDSAMATAGVPTLGISGTDGTMDDGLLPSSDLGWVDDLDTTSIDRLDGWLRRKKG